MQRVFSYVRDFGLTRAPAHRIQYIAGSGIMHCLFVAKLSPVELVRHLERDVFKLLDLWLESNLIAFEPLSHLLALPIDFVVSFALDIVVPKVVLA